MEIQDLEGRVKCVSSEKKTNFHLQSEKEYTCVRTSINIHLPSAVRTLYGKSVILYMIYPENLDTIKYSKLTTFFILFVPSFDNAHFLRLLS